MRFHASAVVVLASLFGLAQPVLAQTFEAVARRVSPGDTVFVLDSSQRTTQGSVVAVGAASITLAGQPALEIPRDSIYRIDKLGDRSWDGAVKGAAIAAPIYGLLVPVACLDSRTTNCHLKSAAAGAFSFGLIGWLIDFAHKGRTTIYRMPERPSPHVALAPILSDRRAGLVMRIAF